MSCWFAGFNPDPDRQMEQWLEARAEIRRLTGLLERKDAELQRQRRLTAAAGQKLELAMAGLTVSLDPDLAMAIKSRLTVRDMGGDV